MKSFLKNSLVLVLSLSMINAFAQDDLYFSKKDREKKRKEREALFQTSKPKPGVRFSSESSGTTDSFSKNSNYAGSATDNSNETVNGVRPEVIEMYRKRAAANRAKYQKQTAAEIEKANNPDRRAPDYAYDPFERRAERRLARRNRRMNNNWNGGGYNSGWGWALGVGIGLDILFGDDFYSPYYDPYVYNDWGWNSGYYYGSGGYCYDPWRFDARYRNPYWRNNPYYYGNRWGWRNYDRGYNRGWTYGYNQGQSSNNQNRGNGRDVVQGGRFSRNNEPMNRSSRGNASGAVLESDQNLNAQDRYFQRSRRSLESSNFNNGSRTSSPNYNNTSSQPSRSYSQPSRSSRSSFGSSSSSGGSSRGVSSGGRSGRSGGRAVSSGGRSGRGG